tara:strand:+ start:212 stop:952 length:741 start_codon:yes stop_codon:yes gene_type:complete
MRKISIINYKGGTGKTCTVVNLAHGLALMGKKVLIIDTDPQGSAGHHLGISYKFSLYDLLINNISPTDCIINARENLDIICSNEHVYPAELKLSSNKDRESVLSKKINSLNGYDYILLDCAPSMNLLNQNALLYSQEILLPVSMEYLALLGVKQLLKNIKILNKIFTKKLNISKVIPTFFDIRNKKSKDIIESLRRVFPDYLSTPIRNSVKLSEAPGFKRTIFEYDPNSYGAEDYIKLVKEVHNDA